MEAGNDSRMIVLNKKTNDEHVVEYKFPQFDLFRKGKRKVLYESRKKFKKDIVEKYNFFNYAEIDNYISTQSLIDQFSFLPDFIIIHSVTHFINAKNINEIYKATNKPIFWNLLDMAPMTGGCHYAWDCEGYKKHCGYCPGLSSKREKDVSRKNYEFKSRYLSEIPLTIIPTTHTLLQQVNSSSLFRDNAKVKIMLAVDATIFKPGEKSLARKTFNLSPSAKIIFAGSQDVTEERKGYHYFIESLEKLNELLTPNERENIIVLLAGHINKKIEIPFKMKCVGFLSEELLVKAYQSSDLFLCASIEDSGPVMINQAVMCGTPVVSFNMGVAPDLVITGETGYLAKLRDSEDLAKGIRLIIEMDNTSYDTMSKNCRELGLNDCHPFTQSNKFFELFNNHLI